MNKIAMRTLPARLVMAVVCVLLAGCGGGGGRLAPEGGGNNGGGEPGLYSSFQLGSQWEYRNTQANGTMHDMVSQVAGKRTISGVQCLELQMGIPGDEGAYSVFVTFSDTRGVVLYGVLDGPGGMLVPVTPPAKFLPGEDGSSFTTTIKVGYVTSGTYQVQTLSRAATVTTPSGTYHNAMQVRQTRLSGDATLGAETITYWTVPGVGFVRIDTNTPGDANYSTLELLRHFPPPGQGLIVGRQVVP